MDIVLREQGEIPITNTLYKFEFEKANKKAAKEESEQQGDEVSEKAPVAKNPRTQKKRSTSKSLAQPILVDAQPSGDKDSEDVAHVISHVQKDPASTTRSCSLGKMP